MNTIFSEQEVQEFWDNRRNVIEFAEQIGRAAIAKASQQVQGENALKLEFISIMSRINSVEFEFVNEEPEPAPRSGKSVPVILGVAWKVFKAAKAMPAPKQEPVQWFLTKDKLPAADETVWVCVRNKNKDGGIWLHDTCSHDGEAWTKRTNTWEGIVAWAYPVDPFTVPAQAAAIPESTAVNIFLSLAEDLIKSYPFLYVEIARTRTTDWMSLIRERPNGTFIASGQGLTPIEACEMALSAAPKPQNRIAFGSPSEDFIPPELLLKPDLTDEDVEVWRKSQEASAPDDKYLCALKTITDSQVNAVARSFWRRIYPFINNYERELPNPLPVEFMAHMATALSWLEMEQSE